jgi:hypothetical protein
LLLKIDEPEWMILKNGGQARGIAREDVELVYTRGAKP